MITSSTEGTLKPGGRREGALGFGDLAADLERTQREKWDDLRERLLEGEAVRDEVWKLFDVAIDRQLAKARSLDEGLRSFVALYRQDAGKTVDEPAGDEPSVREFLRNDVRDAYRRRLSSAEPGASLRFEQRVLLTVLNQQWSRHIARLERAFSAAEGSGGPWEHVSAKYRAASDSSEHQMLTMTADHTLGYLFHAPIVT